MKETVTLIAALIAAVTSVLTLALNIIASLGAEGRAAHRTILGETIGELGEVLHGLMACSTVMIKTKSDESFVKWEGKAKEAQSRLNSIRIKLKYPLWGLDQPLRTMRACSWTAHYRHDGNAARDFLRLADALREQIDLAVKASYASGNPPSLYRYWWASRAETKVLDYYKKTAPAANEENADALDGYSAGAS